MLQQYIGACFSGFPEVQVQEMEPVYLLDKLLSILIRGYSFVIYFKSFLFSTFPRQICCLHSVLMVALVLKRL